MSGRTAYDVASLDLEIFACHCSATETAMCLVYFTCDLPDRIRSASGACTLQAGRLDDDIFRERAARPRGGALNALSVLMCRWLNEQMQLAKVMDDKPV